MKKALALLCTLAMLISATVIGFNLTVAADNTTLSPNGQVAWVTNFSADNLKNWVIDAHTGNMQNAMITGNALFKDVANVSENGVSGTIQAKAGDMIPLTGYKIAADFATYNKLVIKGKYTGDSAAFRASVHNGAHVNSNWGAYGESATVQQDLAAPIKEALKEDGTFFVTVDMSSAAGEPHMWISFGWFLNNTATLAIDYAALTTDTVTDDATATAAIAKYLAGEQFTPPQPTAVTVEKTFAEAVDTQQKYISGAMRIELTCSDFAKLQGCKNRLTLTDGTNNLNWDLANYTFVEGKVNTMLLPFYEGKNATKMATKLNLQAVTGVKLTASDYEGELEVKIGNVDFVNFDELLDTVGIVFYDSCNVMSTGLGVVPGEKGGAYHICNDVDVGEYVADGTAEWARRFGAKGEKFSFNAASRKKLDLTMRVKIDGAYDRFMIQMTSMKADDAYADQNWSMAYYTADSIYSDEQSWITISTADEDDADAWKYGFDNICDITRVLQMRLLAFRQGAAGGNQGTVKVDSIMITDKDRYEGIDNLYLYATADADGGNRQSPYEKEEQPGGDDPAPGGDDPAPGGDDPAPGGDDPAPGGDDPAPGGNDQDSDADASNDNDGDSASPDTGVAFPVAVLALFALSAGGVGVFRKKR